MQLATELTATTWIIAATLTDGLPTEAGQAKIAALITVLGLIDTEITHRSGRARPVLPVPAGRAGAVWVAAAAALLLHPLLLGVLALTLHGHRRWRSRDLPPARRPCPAGLVVTVLAGLAAHAAHAAVDGPSWPPVVATIISVGAFTAAAAGLGAVHPPGAYRDPAVDLAAACLGGVTATAVAVHPLLGPLVLPAVARLRRAALAHPLRELARIDAKTGLLTAAAWDTSTRHALQPRRQDAPPWAVVLLLDLDHFKTVNDTHGHVAGDHVLSAVAAALRATLRRGDLAGRFGGEEFAVLLTSHHPDAVADRIRRAIAALRVYIPTPDGPRILSGLTVSIGGAVHPAHGDDLPALLAVADTALYAAKHAGRDTVRIGSHHAARHRCAP